MQIACSQSLFILNTHKNSVLKLLAYVTYIPAQRLIRKTKSIENRLTLRVSCPTWLLYLIIVTSFPLSNHSFTSNSIPTIAQTNPESQHHPENPQQRQSLDVDSRTLTADIGSSPSVSASRYIVRSIVSEVGAQAPSPKKSVAKPSDGLPAPALVITHDSHDFIDESPDRIFADELVVSPLLAPDTPISSVPCLESVFEISPEFRGDYTLNIYATSPEVVNFRGDIVTTTIHQAIKEVSHEQKWAYWSLLCLKRI